jgi:hypothetical protein
MGRHVSGEEFKMKRHNVLREAMARVIQLPEETSKWTEETEEVFRSMNTGTRDTNEQTRRFN